MPDMVPQSCRNPGFHEVLLLDYLPSHEVRKEVNIKSINVLGYAKDWI